MEPLSCTEAEQLKQLLQKRRAAISVMPMCEKLPGCCSYQSRVCRLVDGVTGGHGLRGLSDAARAVAGGDDMVLL